MPLRLVRDVRGSIHEYTVTLEPADGRSGWRAGAARGLLLLALVMASAAGAAVLGRLQLALAATTAAVLLLASHASQVVSESLVVLRGVGVLLVSRRRWCGGTSAFLDRADIHSAIINESLTTTNIHTHLAFLLHSSDELAVAFPSLSPGLKVLVPLYQELHQLLEA